MIIVNWSDVVYFVALVEDTDPDGFPAIVQGEPRMVFVNRKSVRSQEFNAAKQHGITLSYMFEMRTNEYLGEESLIYNDMEYEVYRTYEKGEFIEIICHRKADDHAS